MYRSIFLSLFLINAVVVGEAMSFYYIYGTREYVPTNDPFVQDLACWSASQLHGHLVKVISAQKQLVAGLLFFITMEIRREDLEIQECQSKILVRSWLTSDLQRTQSAACKVVSSV